MKGTKLLEAKIKAQEWENVKGFKPNDTAATIEAEAEAEDDKVCDTLLSYHYQIL